MRTLRLTKILEFYDVPQLFLATDQLNSNFICMMTDFVADVGYIYFAVQVSHDKLRNFLLGEEDLRQLYLQPEVEDAYFKVVVHNQTITAEAFSRDDITEAILPEEGYFYEEDEDADDYELIQKTQRERFTIFRLGFIDNRNSHEIDTECLAQAISAFQHTITNCHQKLHGKQNAIEASLRVTTFKAASFDVEFKSSSPVDLFGSSQLSDTFSIIDSLMRTSEEEEFKTILRNIKGRTVSNYKNFIKILEDNNLSIKYKWVSSIADKNVVSTSVHKDRVSQIYELLTRNEELMSEEREYEGVFLSSSVENGKWSMRAVGIDKPINGESESAALLSGVTIERKRYQIRCRETQIQNVATLKMENKIILINIQEIYN